MGAWGLGLFQSDHDLDIVNDLDQEIQLSLDDTIFADIARLNIQTEPGQKPAKTIWKMNSTCKSKNTLYAKESTCPSWTCLRIQREKSITDQKAPSDKQRLIAKYTALTNSQKPDLRNPHGSAYKTVILGASLMTLGCFLPDAFIELLREIYSHIGLMRDGLEQMKKALSEQGFKNGTPYDFGSLSQLEIEEVGIRISIPLKDRINPKSRLSNVPAPNDIVPPGGDDHLSEEYKQRLAIERAIIWALTHVNDQVCTHCSATKADHGGSLQRCGRCKTAKYCGRDCQAKDFSIHKAACRHIKSAANVPPWNTNKILIGNRMNAPEWHGKSRVSHPTEKLMKKEGASGNAEDDEQQKLKKHCEHSDNVIRLLEETAKMCGLMKEDATSLNGQEMSGRYKHDAEES